VAAEETFRLLVVEDSFEDERFLRELLEEAAECRTGSRWRVWELLFAATAEEACNLAIDGRFDAILLNLTLPDSRVPHETFTSVAGVTRHAPILVLADEFDDSLETLLIREGAQDFLVKSQLDPEPLARALKRAIERQRYVNSLRLQELPRVAELPRVDAVSKQRLPIDLISITEVRMEE